MSKRDDRKASESVAKVNLHHLHQIDSIDLRCHASSKISRFAILAENDLESVLDGYIYRIRQSKLLQQLLAASDRQFLSFYFTSIQKTV